MSGTFVTKLLAVGNVDDAAISAIYTTPALTATYIKKIKLFNNNAAIQTIDLYVDRGGVVRHYERCVLNQNEHADAFEDISLSAGDIIKGQTTTNAAVPYHVHGVEET